jgi:hypothetical protein
MHPFRTPLASLVLFILFVSGCGNSTEPTVTVEPTFTSIQQNVFAKSCATSSCHGAFGQRGGLILEGDDAYANLVGVLPSNEVALARKLPRVAAGKPDSSFLIVKLTGPGEGEGDRMPQGNNPLNAQAIEAIRTWIANGALRN